ncbi:MAG: phosphate acetyltransferase, partial [Treponema sp.]|nr:phosphate acetyltransferase [Treponema sp.]
MDFVTEMKAKAARTPKRLVLPEGSEERIIRTARILLDEKLASSVTLLGKIADIQEFARTQGFNIDDIDIINTETN